MPEAKKSYKMVLLGEASVGKSSLALRLTRDEFLDNTNATIGAAFFTFKVSPLESNSLIGNNINNNNSPIGPSPEEVVQFDIWDTAGQERFASIAPMYYRGSTCAIVVMDCTCKKSFERAKGWITILKQCPYSNPIIALVANKVDLIYYKSKGFPIGAMQSDRSLLTEAAEYANKEEILFVETSAKTGHNVENLFRLLARHVLDKPKPVEPPKEKIDLRSSVSKFIQCRFC